MPLAQRKKLEAAAFLLLRERMRRERYTRRPFVLLVMLLLTHETSAGSNNVSLSRIERGATDVGYKYLIFPQGSNVQLIYCLTIGSFARPQGIFTLGVTAGLAYELPYRRTVPHRKPAEVYHRRSRRSLYRKLETMLDTQGKNGRGCLLKALCRAGKRNREGATSPKGSFLEEILHSIFTFPDYQDEEEEDEELTRHYQEAYDARRDCDELFHADACPWLF